MRARTLDVSRHTGMLFDLLDDDSLRIIVMQLSVTDAVSLARACRTLAVTVRSCFLRPYLCDAQRELRARLRRHSTDDAWDKTIQHADWREAGLSLDDVRLLTWLCLNGRPLCHLLTVQLGPCESTDFVLPIAELRGDTPMPHKPSSLPPLAAAPRSKLVKGAIKAARRDRQDLGPHMQPQPRQPRPGHSVKVLTENIGAEEPRRTFRNDDGVITELKWARSSVSDHDLAALAVIAAGSPSLRGLYKLNLEGNPQLSDNGIRSLGYALRDGALPELSQLWLSTSKTKAQITEEGLADLCALLKQNRRQLKHAVPALPPIKKKPVNMRSTELLRPGHPNW